MTQRAATGLSPGRGLLAPGDTDIGVDRADVLTAGPPSTAGQRARAPGRLSCELVWATAWEHEANEVVAPWLAQLPVVAWRAADAGRLEVQRALFSRYLGHLPVHMGLP
jgi:hypothetical protein